MDIVDLSWNEVISRRFNNSLFPRSIRGLIVGKSGCGKTTLLINLLLRPGWLDYDNLRVFGKSPLKQIVKNTEHKTTFQIIVSDNKTCFKTRFDPPLQLEKGEKYEIALVNIET